MSIRKVGIIGKNDFKALQAIVLVQQLKDVMICGTYFVDKKYSPISGLALVRSPEILLERNPDVILVTTDDAELLRSLTSDGTRNVFYLGSLPSELAIIPNLCLGEISDFISYMDI